MQCFPAIKYLHSRNTYLHLIICFRHDVDVVRRRRYEHNLELIGGFVKLADVLTMIIRRGVKFSVSSILESH